MAHPYDPRTSDDVLNGPGGYPSPNELPVGRVTFEQQQGRTPAESMRQPVYSIDQLRAEGAAAERERIRLALLAEADALDENERRQKPPTAEDGPGLVACRAVMLGGARFFRKFAATLEPKP